MRRPTQRSAVRAASVSTIRSTETWARTEAVDRHLARPRLPQPAQHRRPRRRDPPKQPFCPLVDPDIAK